MKFSRWSNFLFFCDVNYTLVYKISVQKTCTCTQYESLPFNQLNVNLKVWKKWSFSWLNWIDSSCGISFCCYENNQNITVLKGTFVQDRQTCCSVGPVREARLCMARLVRQRHPETSILVSEQGYTSVSFIWQCEKKNKIDYNAKQINMVMGKLQGQAVLICYVLMQ